MKRALHAPNSKTNYVPWRVNLAKEIYQTRIGTTLFGGSGGRKRDCTHPGSRVLLFGRLLDFGNAFRRFGASIPPGGPQIPSRRPAGRLGQVRVNHRREKLVSRRGFCTGTRRRRA